MASVVEPALASSFDKVPSGSSWLHEIKFDGYRVQLPIANNDIRVFTRRGNDWTKRFKQIAADAYLINAGSAYHRRRDRRALRPVTGHDNLRKFIGGFIRDWTQTTWDVLNVMSNGDVVMAERLDRTRVGDRSVDLPCCGVFELSNGRIKVWRDYFDLATYTRAIMPAK